MNIKILSLNILFLLSSVLISKSVFAQYPVPASEDTTEYGKGVQRTMQLLASSTPTNKRTVKILVYGQSISKQEWWEKLQDSLRLKYPNANLIMENKGIGGFASQLLWKPMFQDVLPFNPDLVLFHVYGSQWTYDTIMRNIRTYTTAEIGIQTDHVTSIQEDDWTKYFNYQFLPKEDSIYKLELMQIRPAYYKYLADNSYTPFQLTLDGTHLNDTGCYVLSTLIKRHLAYKPKFPTDPQKLVTTYEIGKDIFFSNGKISLPFVGNGVEFIANNGSGIKDPLTVTIDGHKPSSFPGTYFYTRANDSSNVKGYFQRSYTDRRIDWPWQVGTNYRIKGTTTVVEDWTATISNFQLTSNACKFSIALKGSVTGDDGGGKVILSKRTTSPDTSVFGWVGVTDPIVSNSGKVILGSNDWWIPQAIENTKAVIGNGYVIKWSSFAMNMDQYTKPVITDPNLEYVSTIAHGLPHANHLLEISGGSSSSVLKTIRIYSPYYNRPATVTSIDDKEIFSSIIVSPNPASQFINIDMREYEGKNVQLKIISTTGRTLGKFSENASSAGKVQLNIADLDAGLYFLQIEMEKQITTRKFIVLK